jgi:hypothetical protein
MRGRKQDRSARVVIAGRGFVQNLRRGHYELAVEEPVARRLAVRLTSLPWRSDARPYRDFTVPRTDQMQQRRDAINDKAP